MAKNGTQTGPDAFPTISSFGISKYEGQSATRPHLITKHPFLPGSGQMRPGSTRSCRIRSASKRFWPAWHPSLCSRFGADKRVFACVCACELERFARTFKTSPVGYLLACDGATVV